jgi:hypothetical protein
MLTTDCLHQQNLHVLFSEGSTSLSVQHFFTCTAPLTQTFLVSSVSCSSSPSTRPARNHTQDFSAEVLVTGTCTLLPNLVGAEPRIWDQSFRTHVLLSYLTHIPATATQQAKMWNPALASVTSIYQCPGHLKVDTAPPHLHSQLLKRPIGSADPHIHWYPASRCHLHKLNRRT